MGEVYVHATRGSVRHQTRALRDLIASWLCLAPDSLSGVRFLCLSRKRLSKRPYRSLRLSGNREPR